MSPTAARSKPIPSDGERRRLEYVDLDDLASAKSNPKRHDQHVIAAGIERFGMVDIPHLDDRTGRIIAGHGRRDRLLECRSAGQPPPPRSGVIVDEAGRWLVPTVRGWASRDDAEAHAAGIALNQATIAGGFDLDDLAALTRDLQASDETLVAALGFSDAELAALLTEPPAPSTGHGEPDTYTEDVAPTTRTGDVWQLGRHRLLCGNSTKRETYAALLDTERPALMVTDPPYGVAYQAAGSEKRAILGDLSQATIPVSLAASLPHLDDDARIIMCGGSDQFAMYLNLFDFHLRQQPRVIVWVKEHFVLRHVGFHSRYELVYYGWKGDGGKAWFGDRTPSDVWEITRTRDTDHDTEKPVALFEIPVRHLAGPADLVLDPFAGSGVAVIACEQQGRTARVIEQDPHWCDVIARRWQDYSGQLPTRNGEPVDLT